MAEMARKLSDADANAVSHWLSTQTVPFPAKPASAQPLAPQENRRVQRDPDAPVRFIIDAQPVSYETIQSSF